MKCLITFFLVVIAQPIFSQKKMILDSISVLKEKGEIKHAITISERISPRCAGIVFLHSFTPSNNPTI